MRLWVEIGLKEEKKYYVGLGADRGNCKIPEWKADGKDNVKKEKIDLSNKIWPKI